MVNSSISPVSVPVDLSSMTDPDGPQGTGGQRSPSAPPPARPRRARTHPQVVEGDVGEPLSGDVLAELLGQSGLLLGVHGQHRARDQLLDAARGKVPRLDPHQVVEGELDDEAALGAHLEDGRDEPEGGET